MMVPTNRGSAFRWAATATHVIAWLLWWPACVSGDGLLKAAANYEGSLEERSQEAVIVFKPSSIPGQAHEDLILRIEFEGDAEEFAWVIPFPNEPRVEKADAKIFQELFEYVESRRFPGKKQKSNSFGGVLGVEVISREVVGSYDVATVRETQSGSLNEWLEQEGFQTISNGKEVIEHYREREYVFTCIKVHAARRGTDTPAALHPLWFSFKPGGRDGIYFPMKLTSLQRGQFDVNLYVFSPMWINRQQNAYGYEQHGFREKYQGKIRLNEIRLQMPALAAALRAIRADVDAYHLTNLQAQGLEANTVRRWPHDLWLFPRYRDPKFVPRDVRERGPAWFPLEP